MTTYLLPARAGKGDKRLFGHYRRFPLSLGAVGDGRISAWGAIDATAYPRQTILAGDEGETINQHSADVHIIPATDKVAAALRRVEPNDRVLLEGYLVDVVARKADESGTWQLSISLNRSDTGDGACEILYVKQLVLDTP